MTHIQSHILQQNLHLTLIGCKSQQQVPEYQKRNQHHGQLSLIEHEKTMKAAERTNDNFLSLKTWWAWDLIFIHRFTLLGYSCVMSQIHEDIKMSQKASTKHQNIISWTTKQNIFPTLTFAKPSHKSEWVTGWSEFMTDSCRQWFDSMWRAVMDDWGEGCQVFFWRRSLRSGLRYIMSWFNIWVNNNLFYLNATSSFNLIILTCQSGFRERHWKKWHFHKTQHWQLKT